MTRPTRLYIATVVLAACGLAAALLARSSTPTPRELVIGLTFSGLMVLAMRYPLAFGPQMKLNLDTSVTIAAILLFPPGLAMLVVGLGVVVAQRLRRVPLYGGLFNTGQIMLQAGVGGMILHATGWDHTLSPFVQPASLAGFVAAVVAMYLLMTCLVSTVAWLHTGHRPQQAAPHAVWSAARSELPSQVSLGVLAAAITHVTPWALPLLVPLGVAVSRARERHLELNKKNEALAH
jgi:hypothetical protein